MPPGFGRDYADRQAMQQRLEAALVGSDLDRRSGLMQNIISNAPNIAALSGVGAVDQLANMFSDSETPIFNNEYGQQGDMLRRQMDMIQLANASRPRTSGGSSGGSGVDVTGMAVDPNRSYLVIPEGHPDAGKLVPFDNVDQLKDYGAIFNIPPERLREYIRAPGAQGTASVGVSGKGSGVVPGFETQTPGSVTGVQGTGGGGGGDEDYAPEGSSVNIGGVNYVKRNGEWVAQ